MSRLSALRTAIGFLTRVPVGRADGTADPATASIGKAAPWFPVAGLAIGAAQGLVLLGARSLIPPLPAAVVAVAAGTLITGAFHHDGLADMADAFGGGWSVEERLAILKDSRLGTYGTSALILAFATEISVLASLEPIDGFMALLAANTLSRAVAVAVMVRAPLAAGGLGASYAAELSTPGAAVAAAFGLVVTVLAFGDVVPVLAAVALAVMAAVAVVALAIRKIGGVTGDVLGAVQQLSSLSILLAAAIG